MNRYAVVIIYRDSAGVLQVGQNLVNTFEEAQTLAEGYPNIQAVHIYPWRVMGLFARVSA